MLEAPGPGWWVQTSVHEWGPLGPLATWFHVFLVKASTWRVLCRSPRRVSHASETPTQGLVQRKHYVRDSYQISRFSYCSLKTLFNKLKIRNHLRILGKKSCKRKSRMKEIFKLEKFLCVFYLLRLFDVLREQGLHLYIRKFRVYKRRVCFSRATRLRANNHSVTYISKKKKKNNYFPWKVGFKFFKFKKTSFLSD